MPRRPRIHLPSVPIHLVQRGHNREACFFTDEDFLAYRDWLAEALKKSGCVLYAYVLMTNHVHLLLTPPCSAAVSQLEQQKDTHFVSQHCSAIPKRERRQSGCHTMSAIQKQAIRKT